MISNGGFEAGLKGWTRWGKNANLITLESGAANSGTNAVKIVHGHNALVVNSPVAAGKAYEISLFERLAGENPAGQIAISYSTEGGAFRSAGFKLFKIVPSGKEPGDWTNFRQVFVPPAVAVSAQFAFTALDGSTIWLDDISLREVPRPSELAEPPAAWDGLKRRTEKPLFKELLTTELGHYTVMAWAHDLNRNKKREGGVKSPELNDDVTWLKAVAEIFKESGEAGMGFLDLPGHLDGSEPWRTAAFHREQFEKYGTRFDVWTEGSGSVAAALKRGAELLNPAASELGRARAVSCVDPEYVAAQEQILRKLGAELGRQPFVGVYYGRDEPTVHLPEGKVERWGAYGQAMAKEVREKYGFGKFAVPMPKDKEFLNDTNKPLRWIAYNRWANDKFIESRTRLAQALHAASPGARYSPANYWFMSGFAAFDYTRLASCSDMMELDPYASSAEKSRGRGVFNHGFGAKFMSDLGGKPVRVIAQAFNYAGYTMKPDDLREWVSQAMRSGASAIDYYTMDSPRWTDLPRWKMMLHLSSVITRMNRVSLPTNADTAIIYTLYTHMAMGATTPADQLYTAHALVGEMAGSWFRFVSDAQLERGEADLAGYKTIYLPVARYLTPEATAKIEAAVRGGATLVCGDAEAFGFDLEGKNTAGKREGVLGIRTVGAKAAGKTILQTNAWELKAGTELPLFDAALWDQTSPGQARQIEVVDKTAQILGTYADGSPAIVSRSLGKGRVITFAANPFTPEVVVEKSAWPELIKGLQKSTGCKVELPIWRFQIPPMPAQPN